MQDSYQDVGIGIEVGQFSGDLFQGSPHETMITTEKFGAHDAQKGAAITGVVFTDKVINDDFYTVGEGLGGITIEARSSTGESFKTMTGHSGGYSLRVPSGSYTVYASGGELGAVRMVGSTRLR